MMQFVLLAIFQMVQSTPLDYHTLSDYHTPSDYQVTGQQEGRNIDVGDDSSNQLREEDKSVLKFLFSRLENNNVLTYIVIN